MTDFFADLEAELTGAARRRVAGARTRRRPRLRRLGRPVLALVPVAGLVSVVLFAAVRLDGAPDGGERLTGVAPAGAARVVLEAPVAAASCSVPSRPPARAVPREVGETLGLLRRPQTPLDALPEFAPFDDDAARRESDLSWLPVTGLRSGDVRRPGVDRPGPEVYVVPSSGVQTDEACDGEERSGKDDGPGACLVSGAPRFEVGCFTLEQIRAGRAVTLAPGNAEPPTVIGLAPDGVERVTVDAGRGPERAGVVENLYAVTVPGARAGAPLDVTMLRPGEQGPPQRIDCSAPPPPLHGTRQPVPESLEELVPPGPRAELPPEAEAVIRDLDAERVHVEGIRAVGVDEGIVILAVPLSGAAGERRCAPGAPDPTPVPRQALCLVAMRTGRALGSACFDPGAARRGAWDFVSFAGRQLLLGVAPRAKEPAAAGELVLSETGTGVGFGIRGGVFAAVLPHGVSERRARESAVRFGEGRFPVTVVDATGGSAPVSEIAKVHRAAGGGSAMGAVGRPELATARSRVLYAPAAGPRAAVVAQRLGIADVRPLAGDPAAPFAFRAAIVVVLGKDRVP